MILVDTIFHYLFKDERFFGITFNYLTVKMFQDPNIKQILLTMKDYANKYNTHPTFSDVKLLLDNDDTISELRCDELFEVLDKIEQSDVSTNYDLVMEETEEWVLHRSCELALADSLDVLDRGKPKGQMVDYMKSAVSVSFSDDLGIEYIKDAENQYDFYTTPQQYLQCSLKALNDAWSGGLRRKALHLFIGGVNKGKSIFLAFLAGSLMVQGYNVVLISAEMSKEELRRRIDANILDLYMDSLGVNLKEEDYFTKIKEVANIPQLGRLFIKDYAQGTCHRNHISFYLQELKLKRHFKPDVLITDYLNEFASSRLPAGASADSYKYVKSIAGEQRALAFEWDMAVVSATQFNKKQSVAGVDEVDMTGTAESFGVPAVADHMAAIVQNEEMREANRYLIKNIKTRFGDNLHATYALGIDRPKMRLYDVDEDAQETMPISVRDEMKYNDSIRMRRPKEYDEDGDEKVLIFNNELDD